MSCTAILEIVSIRTGDDDIAKLERSDGLRNAMRLIGGGRLGSAVRQVAECAATGAQFPENQKGGRTVREAFGTVGAGSFAADGGERIRRQDVANWVFGSSGNGSSHLEPGGLWKRLGAVGSCLTRNFQYFFETASCRHGNPQRRMRLTMPPTVRHKEKSNSSLTVPNMTAFRSLPSRRGSSSISFKVRGSASRHSDSPKTDGL